MVAIGRAGRRVPDDHPLSDHPGPPASREPVTQRHGIAYAELPQVSDPAAGKTISTMRTMFFWAGAHDGTYGNAGTRWAREGWPGAVAAGQRRVRAGAARVGDPVQVCRVIDRLEQIEVELSGAPLTVEGSTGQPKAHPLLAEWRHQARVLESLSRALSIPLPGEDVGRRRSPTAREAAVQRWHGGVA